MNENPYAAPTGFPVSRSAPWRRTWKPPSLSGLINVAILIGAVRALIAGHVIIALCAAFFFIGSAIWKSRRRSRTRPS
jgi:hypothetical protein